MFPPWSNNLILEVRKIKSLITNKSYINTKTKIAEKTQKFKSTHTDRHTTYDTLSIMHYDSLLGGSLRDPIMKTITGESIGINKEMSKLDIEKLNQMYPCKQAGPASSKFLLVTSLIRTHLDLLSTQNGGNQEDAKLIEKLKNDKLKLQGHLKMTRDNNELLKNMIDELKTENEELENNRLESKAQVVILNKEIAFMKKSIEELTRKNEQSEKNAEELEERIQQLKMNESQLVSDIENCESSDANLVLSQQETKECFDELEIASKLSFEYQTENILNLKMIDELKSNQTKLIFDLDNLKNTETDLVLSQREHKNCTEKARELNEEVERLKVIQSKLISELNISRQESKQCNKDHKDDTQKLRRKNQKIAYESDLGAAKNESSACNINHEYNHQLSIIERLESEIEVAERELVELRSQIFRYKPEIERLQKKDETSEERCQNNLQDLRASFASTIRRYNKLVKSKFYIW